MINILFAARPEQWPEYSPHLRSAIAESGLNAQLSTNLPAEHVDYIVYSPAASVRDFTPFKRLKAVLNLWAGVEGIVSNDTLKVPLARMADSGMAEGMVDYVVAHVMRHHIGMDAHLDNPNRAWVERCPPLARDRRVAILGIGALGSACATALVGLGFDVHGWSRSSKDLQGVTSHSGAGGLKKILPLADIVVLLTPSTAQTANLINAQTLALLPKGAVIINPGRGPLIDDAALLSALDSGHIAHATLDVFRTEPLPKDDPYWSHPNVTVTPHIASTTRPETAAQRVVENIRRNEAGQPMLNVVDRRAGY